MATDVKKHTSPAPGEVPSRAQLAAMILSANDVIPVANATERAQIVAALISAGVGPTSSRPIIFSRADAAGLHRLEYTYDGVAFVTSTGILQFASKGAANSWGATNSVLLSIGDQCFAGGSRFYWTGAKWRPEDLSLRVPWSGAQAIAANTTLTVTAYGTAMTTESTLVNIASGVVTVQLAGWWLLSIAGASDGASGDKFVFAELNGTKHLIHYSVTSARFRWELTKPILLAAGDNIRVKVLRGTADFVGPNPDDTTAPAIVLSYLHP